ncbi:ABC transporter permease [Azotosporobacter soli]|uniref:ABC transporter permease n=1 Tax=Azotosporobacter soli TaxID=3055040 RepID=UPI0031FE93BD
MSRSGWFGGFKDELRHIFRRQPKLALLLFGVPLFCSLAFGSVYGGNVIKNIPTVVYDQDQTKVSRALVQAFADSERYDIVLQVDSQEELENALQENAALAALSIPPAFSLDIKSNRASQLLVTSSSDNLLYANAIASTSQEIIQTFAAGAAAKLLEVIDEQPDQALRNAAPLRLGIRLLNNPTSAYNYFMLPSLGAHTLQLGIMLATCGVMLRQRQRREGAVSLAGRLCAYWLCSFIAYLSYLTMIHFVFAIPIRGSLWQIGLLGFTFTGALVSVGSFFSSAAKDELDAVRKPMLYIMPASLFSGFSWPFMAMNDFSYIFSALMPLSYCADPLRDLLLAGYTPVFWQSIASLLAFAVFFLSTACLLLKRNSKEVAS